MQDQRIVPSELPSSAAVSHSPEHQYPEPLPLDHKSSAVLATYKTPLMLMGRNLLPAGQKRRQATLQSTRQDPHIDNSQESSGLCAMCTPYRDIVVTGEPRGLSSDAPSGRFLFSPAVRPHHCVTTCATLEPPARNRWLLVTQRPKECVLLMAPPTLANPVILQPEAHSKTL